MTDSILNFDDSAVHMRIHYREEYPMVPAERATFGNVPKDLHMDITQLAAKHQMQIPMAIAALYDFYLEYEALNLDALVKLRAVSGKKVRG